MVTAGEEMAGGVDHDGFEEAEDGDGLCQVDGVGAVSWWESPSRRRPMAIVG